MPSDGTIFFEDSFPLTGSTSTPTIFIYNQMTSTILPILPFFLPFLGSFNTYIPCGNSAHPSDIHTLLPTTKLSSYDKPNNKSRLYIIFAPKYYPLTSISSTTPSKNESISKTYSP